MFVSGIQASFGKGGRGQSESAVQDRPAQPKVTTSAATSPPQVRPSIPASRRIECSDGERCGDSPRINHISLGPTIAQDNLGGEGRRRLQLREDHPW